MAIHGSGVAASCCALLLRDAGFSFSLTAASRPRIPAILIGESTQALIRDVFGRPDLLRDLFQIDRRIVAWGPRADPVELPHRAAVISEDALLVQLGPPRPDGSSPGSADWTVYASLPQPAPFEEHAFGSRTASATAVELKSETSACWIESLQDGWLFLVPGSSTTGWLISVGGPLGDMLAQSRLVAQQVHTPAASGGAFPAHPRIVDPLCAPGWLACGTAAMAFDPICGDGTGNAIREAILAAAVIRAAPGGDREGLLTHYRGRLVAGMMRHLELCRTFYLSGNGGPWWKRELAALDKGIAWCRRTLPGGQFQYRLNGFELEKIG